MSIEQMTRDPKVWEVARSYAIAMGEVPNSFGTTVRTLISDHLKDPNNYSRGSVFLAGRLLKSQSVSVPLFYATKTFYPDRVGKNDSLTPGEVFALYKPFDLAAVLATMYAFRKAKRRAPADLWSPLSKVALQSTDLGGLVGAAMPKVGFAAGLLAGAFNYISIVPFMLQNPKVFKDYKRKCAAKGVKYDLKLEMEMMGCTHAHVCSFILPALGLGVAASQLVTEGLLCELGPIPTPDKDPYRVYIATVWINSLMKNGAIPDITHKGGFYPLKADLDKLLTQVAIVNQETPALSWLDKGKSDDPASAASPEEEEIPLADIPDDVRRDIESS